MAFQKEHELANEYYHTKPESFGFTNNVGNRGVYYYVEIKRGDRNFFMEEEKRKLKEIFDKFDLASEGWEEFSFKLEEAPFRADYDFDFIVYSERDNYL